MRTCSRDEVAVILQIAALSKQNESDSRFKAELVSDREEEREHFEQQMEKMRNEVELAREIVNSEALLTEKVDVAMQSRNVGQSYNLLFVMF